MQCIHKHGIVGWCCGLTYRKEVSFFYQITVTVTVSKARRVRVSVRISVSIRVRFSFHDRVDIRYLTWSEWNYTSGYQWDRHRLEEHLKYPDQ